MHEPSSSARLVSSKIVRVLRSLAAALLAVSLAASGLLVRAHAAQAAAPDAQGWWWTSQGVGGTGLAAPTSPPDVPASGLYVQADVSSSTPVAFAAVVYRIPTGSSLIGPLTLAVSQSSATSPNASLEACPLISPEINAEQGGPAADAPSYDCRTHVQADISSDGSSFTLPVTKLVSEGVLAVALLPAAGMERVVLDHPASDSLPEQTSTGVSSAPAASPSGGPAPTAPPSAIPASPSTAPVPSVGGPTGAVSMNATSNGPSARSVGPELAVGPIQASAPPRGTAGPTVNAVAGSPTFSTPEPVALSGAGSPEGSSGGNPLAWGVLVAGVTVAAGMWAASRGA